MATRSISWVIELSEIVAAAARRHEVTNNENRLENGEVARRRVGGCAKQPSAVAVSAMAPAARMKMGAKVWVKDVDVHNPDVFVMATLKGVKGANLKRVRGTAEIRRMQAEFERKEAEAETS